MSNLKLVNRGAETRAWARDTIKRLKGIAQLKRTPTRRELTPPIQTDAERGEGDSINARLHRALYGAKK